MLKIENTCVTGWSAAIRGMRNPYNSWDKSDSAFTVMKKYDCEDGRGSFLMPEYIGQKDLALMKRLVVSGDCHAKFSRMLIVTADITAPRYWWTQFDQYHYSVTNSCSTMHTILDEPFTIEDFSTEHLNVDGMVQMYSTIRNLNQVRDDYHAAAAEKDEYKKMLWWNAIQNLPQSYLQKRTVQTNYQSLRNMHYWRKDHKLTEWHRFCDWVEHLPYAKDLILAEKTGEWIGKPDEVGVTCSVCKKHFEYVDNCIEHFLYCPNCGTKMETLRKDGHNV